MAKGQKKQTQRPQKRKPKEVVDLRTPPKKKPREGEEDEGVEGEKKEALAGLSDVVTDRWYQNMMKSPPLVVLESIPGYIAKLGLAASRAQEAIDEARSSIQDVAMWTQKAEESEKRANEAEEQNRQLGEEKSALEEKLKELEERERKWEEEKVTTARELKEERRRAKLSSKELEALQEQINKEREENERKLVEARREGRAEGVAEAGDKFLYITHIHYPNPKCPNFSFKIYGEAGEAAQEELAADEDVKKDREYIQAQYDSGVILPELLPADPGTDGEDAEEVAALNEAQRLANLSSRGQENFDQDLGVPIQEQDQVAAD